MRLGFFGVAEPESAGMILGLGAPSVVQGSSTLTLLPFPADTCGAQPPTVDSIIATASDAASDTV